MMNIYKEKGYTSHDVVAVLRRILQQKKIGHAGTLDPEAEGVLPVFLGQATKLCELFSNESKCYEAILKLGYVTDTQDLTGTILQKTELLKDSISKEQLLQTLQQFEGKYEQIPPMYSALKVHGKKLYELAREGKEIERKPRTVWIKKINVKQWISYDEVQLQVVCSKGTYIRTLCHDIGMQLGCGGCMKALCRTGVGKFSIEESQTLEQICQRKETGSLHQVIYSLEQLCAQYVTMRIKPQYQHLLYNGNVLRQEMFQEMGQSHCVGTMVSAYDANNHLVAVYVKKTETEYKPAKMFLLN